MTVKAPKKSEQTREHILETALDRFAEKGYAETTMRDIAGAADCSLGLAYRYFARKEEFILALYERLTNEFEEEVSRLPPAPLAKRFASAMQVHLRRLGAHRKTMGALFAAGLAPDSEVAVLGDNVSGIRSRIWRIFERVVTGASDAPKRGQAEQMTTLLYAAHLLFVLFWLQDRSLNQAKTQELLGFAQEMLGRLRPVLGLPPVVKPLTKLVGIIGPMFGPVSAPGPVAAIPAPSDGSSSGAGSDGRS